MIRKTNTNKTNQLIVYRFGSDSSGVGFVAYHFASLQAHRRERMPIDTQVVRLTWRDKSDGDWSTRSNNKKI